MTCIDCKKKIDKAAQRCKSCAMRHRHKVKPFGFQHGMKVRLGMRLSPLSIAKMKESLRGKYIEDENWNYKGTAVKYRGLHNWVERRRGKPSTCEDCGRTGLTGHQIHWANVSGKYLRDLSDWCRLCAKCHMQSHLCAARL